MAKNIKPTDSCSSGVGSLPHTDPKAACQDILHYCPEIPYAPTLPNINMLESIIFHDSEFLPGKVIEGNKLYVDRNTDFSSGMEQIYMDYMEEGYERYAADPVYAEGYLEMSRQSLKDVPCIKCQVTGPMTFGLTITDQEKKPLAYDSQYYDMLSKMLALRGRWYESIMQKTGADQTLLIVDEPYFAALGSSVMSVDTGMVESAYNDFASLIEGGIGYHCCSNTDWGFLMSLKPAVISFDAYGTSREFLLYKDQIATYLEQGGVIAWGIVPAEYQVFEKETSESLWKRYMSIRDDVASFTSYELFDSQAVITPSCGLKLADVTGARTIMKTVAEISRRVRTL